MSVLTTKNELIQYFSGLPVSTLQKLQRYSELLIIPDEDLLTNATMQQMVDKAHQLADIHFPQWTDRSKSDFGEFLVELLAMFSEKDFWYINAFASDNVLSKTRSYETAFSKAALVGYEVPVCTASRAQFALTFASGEAFRYDRGTLRIVAGGVDYTNIEPFTLPAGSQSLVVPLREGKNNTDNVSYNGYEVQLSDDHISIDTIVVTINDVTYARVNNFGNSSPDSTHFMVIPDEDGAANIYFGDGEHGVNPPIGASIRIEYLTTSGTDKPIVTDPTDVYISDSITQRPILSAAMVTDATGGQTPPTLSQLKQGSLAFAMGRNVAFNRETAQKMLMEYPFVKKARVWSSIDAESLEMSLMYACVPTDLRDNLSPTEYATLMNEFEPKTPLGYTAVKNNALYVSPTATLPDFSSFIIDIKVSRGVDFELVKSVAKQTLLDYLDPRVYADFSKGLILSEVETAIRAHLTGIELVKFYWKNTSGVVTPLYDILVNEGQIFRALPDNNVSVMVEFYAN